MRFLQLSTLSFLFACGEEIPSSFKEGDSDYDGVTEEEGDCDDSTAAISPNMFDFVGDGIDNNCDGIDGEDSDGDGFASEASGGTDCCVCLKEKNPNQIFAKSANFVRFKIAPLRV